MNYHFNDPNNLKFLIKNIHDVNNVSKSSGIIDIILKDKNLNITEIILNGNTYSIPDISNTAYSDGSFHNASDIVDTILMHNAFENVAYNNISSKYKIVDHLNFAFQKIKNVLNDFAKDLYCTKDIVIKKNESCEELKELSLYDKVKYIKLHYNSIYMSLLNPDLYNFSDKTNFELYENIIKCINIKNNDSIRTSIQDDLNYELYAILTSRWAFIPPEIIKEIAIQYINLILSSSIQSRMTNTKLEYTLKDDTFELTNNIEHSDILNIFLVLLLANVVAVCNNIKPIKFIVKSQIANEQLLSWSIASESEKSFYSCFGFIIKDENLDNINNLIINMINDLSVDRYGLLAEKIIHLYAYINTEHSIEKFNELISKLLETSDAKNSDALKMMNNMCSVQISLFTNYLNTIYIDEFSTHFDNNFNTCNMNKLMEMLTDDFNSNKRKTIKFVRSYMIDKFKLNEYLSPKSIDCFINLITTNKYDASSIMSDKCSFKIKKSFSLTSDTESIFKGLSNISSPLLLKTVINYYLLSYNLFNASSSSRYSVQTPDEDVVKEALDNILEIIYKSNNSYKMLLSRFLFGLCSSFNLSNGDTDIGKIYFSEVSKSLLSSDIKYLLLTGDSDYGKIKVNDDTYHYKNPSYYGVKHFARYLFSFNINEIVDILGETDNVDPEVASYYTEKYMIATF